MLRGAIDLVGPDAIGGWIYSDLGPVADRIVLAFVDDHCIGSGRVGLVREDLKAAGLGDGRFGFNFPIAAAGDADLTRIVIKLEGSDLALLQPSATVARANAYQPIVAGPERLDWLRTKGLLSPAELTFLRYLQQMSVFDHSLVLPRNGPNPKIEIAEPASAAQGLFDLLCLRRVELKQLDLMAREAGEIVTAACAIGRAPLCVAAIHCNETGVISVVEGSHAAPGPGEGFEAAIDYHFGPDRLLFLDLNARFRLSHGRPAPLRVFCAF